MDSSENIFPVHSLSALDGFEELHSSGLLYIEIPVLKDDHFQVPVLDGFVMNRLAGDFIESLLYKVFSTLTSQTVEDLSQLLDENLEVKWKKKFSLCLKQLGHLFT